jgi:glycosyltransferase involved in cell wall biosynthesis
MPNVSRKRVVVHFSPLARTKGGISTVLANYCSSTLADEYEFVTVETHRDGSKLAKALTAVLAILKGFRALLRRPDIAHVHVGDFPSVFRKIVVTLAVVLGAKKSILHFHGADFMREYERLSPPMKSLVRWYVNLFDTVVCLSESWKAQLINTFKIREAVVVRNAVPLPRELRARPQSNGVVRFAFLGSIIDRKGVFDLPPAMRILLEQGCHANLLIGGSGELNRLTLEIARLGIAENVEVVGWVDASQRDAILQSVDAFVLPSYAEGMPMALLEAMACGLPVISTPVGGIPELVAEGVSGILVEPGNTAAIAQAMKTLIDDPSLRQSMGMSGRRQVEEVYSFETHLNELGRIYKSVS